MTDREAMQMALGALNELTEEFRGYDLPYGSKAYNKATDAINSLHQALAQPEQEPAPVGITCKVWTHGCALFDGIDLPNETLLYTAPPSKPCEITDLLQQKFQSGNNVPVERVTITRSEYEAALRSKNDPTSN